MKNKNTKTQKRLLKVAFFAIIRAKKLKMIYNLSYDRL